MMDYEGNLKRATIAELRRHKLFVVLALEYFKETWETISVEQQNFIKENWCDTVFDYVRKGTLNGEVQTPFLVLYKLKFKLTPVPEELNATVK